MRSRLQMIFVVIGVLLAIGVIGFVAYTFLATPSTKATATPIGGAKETAIPTQDVIVALQPIARGAPFVAGSIGRRPWPKIPGTELPPDIIADEVETIGKVAKTEIVQGQLIVRSMLSDVGERGEASLLIPPGRVAVAFPMNRQSSVAYGIKAGDTVDILVTSFFVDVDEQTQTVLPNKMQFLIFLPSGEVQGTIKNSSTNAKTIGTAAFVPQLIDAGYEGKVEIFTDDPPVTAIINGNGESVPRRVAQLTVQAAKVLRVGTWFAPTPTPQAQSGGAAPAASGAKGGASTPTPTPPLPDIVTLAVTPQDALVLLWIRQSRISAEMALRAAGEENADHLTEAVTLQYMLTRFNISVPPKIEFVMQERTVSDEQLEYLMSLGLDKTLLQQELKRRPTEVPGSRTGP